MSSANRWTQCCVAGARAKLVSVDISRRVIGVAAVLKREDRNPVGVDLNSVLTRLILFEQYILKSLRLQEIPYFVQQLGFDGTMKLLKSSAFRIECECVCVAQIGQTSIIESRAFKGVLPPLSYCLSAIDSGDYEKYIHDNLQVFHKIPNLVHKQVKALKLAVVENLARLPNGFASEVAAAARADVLSKAHLVRTSVELVLKRDLGIELPDLQVAVHAIDEEDIRVDTNLVRPGIDVQIAHKIVERALMGVGSVAHRFAEMKAYSALTGFTGDDLPLVQEHLGFLARTVLPEDKEQQLTRVLQVVGLPDFTSVLANREVNIPKLLELRESQECIEFRHWLSRLNPNSDDEIRERMESLRAKLGNFAQTRQGKLTRFLVTTGIGFIPVVGPLAGTLAGGIDSFLLEKILPKSGPLAFVSKLYGSVFEERK